jgi:hypothetical protein
VKKPKARIESATVLVVFVTVIELADVDAPGALKSGWPSSTSTVEFAAIEIAIDTPRTLIVATCAAVWLLVT